MTTSREQIQTVTRAVAATDGGDGASVTQIHDWIRDNLPDRYERLFARGGTTPIAMVNMILTYAWRNGRLTRRKLRGVRVYGVDPNRPRGFTPTEGDDSV